MARITQIAGAVLLVAAVVLYVFVVVWDNADGYEGVLQTTGVAILMGSLGLVGSIGATIVLWRRRAEDREVARLSR